MTGLVPAAAAVLVVGVVFLAFRFRRAQGTLDSLVGSIDQDRSRRAGLHAVETVVDALDPRDADADCGTPDPKTAVTR